MHCFLWKTQTPHNMAFVVPRNLDDHYDIIRPKVCRSLCLGSWMTITLYLTFVYPFRKSPNIYRPDAFAQSNASNTPPALCRGFAWTTKFSSTYKPLCKVADFRANHRRQSQTCSRCLYCSFQEILRQYLIQQQQYRLGSLLHVGRECGLEFG